MFKSFKSIPQTFHSRAFYADLVLSWKGIGIGFIIIGLLFSYVGPLLAQLPKLPAAQETILNFFDRLPDVTIKSQKLSIDRPSPFTVEVKLNDEQTFVLVFDTAYQEHDVKTLTAYMDNKNIDVLLTSDFAAIRKNRDGMNVEIHDYSRFAAKTIEVRHEKWVAMADKVAMLFPFIFVIALIPVFLFMLVFAFFKALVVKFFALFMTFKPDLPAAMRLGVAASIPASVLTCLLAVFGAIAQSKPYTVPVFVLMLIWIGFVFFGLSAARKAAANKPTT